MKRITGSARQLVRAIEECEDDRLDEALAEASSQFHGLAERALATLVHDRGFGLAAAYAKLKAAGFRVGHVHLTANVLLRKLDRRICQLPTVAALELPDFELCFGFWEQLEEEVKGMLSVRFVKYWQSPAGAARLEGVTLQRLRKLWRHTPPSSKQRLEPGRACGLGWSKRETMELLESHVDLDGDATALVAELLARGLLPPGETLAAAGGSGGRLAAAPGLIGALVWTAPRRAAERLLAGELSTGSLQPTIVLALAEALAAATAPLGTPLAGTPLLGTPQAGTPLGNPLGTPLVTPLGTAGAGAEAAALEPPLEPLALTPRAVKHFGHFVAELSSGKMAQCTNATLAMVTPRRSAWRGAERAARAAVSFLAALLHGRCHSAPYRHPAAVRVGAAWPALHTPGGTTPTPLGLLAEACTPPDRAHVAQHCQMVEMVSPLLHAGCSRWRRGCRSRSGGPSCALSRRSTS